MKRRLFTILVVVSLVLCLATCALWAFARDYRLAIGSRAKLHLEVASLGEGIAVVRVSSVKVQVMGQYWVILPKVILAAPYVALVPLFLVLPLTRLVVWSRRRLEHTRGKCERCGYDLRETPEGCPECGAVPVGGKA